MKIIKLGEDNKTWIIIYLTWTNTSDETKNFSGAIGDEEVHIKKKRHI